MPQPRTGEGEEQRVGSPLPPLSGRPGATRPTPAQPPPARGSSPTGAPRNPRRRLASLQPRGEPLHRRHKPRGHRTEGAPGEGSPPPPPVSPSRAGGAGRSPTDLPAAPAGSSGRRGIAGASRAPPPRPRFPLRSFPRPRRGRDGPGRGGRATAAPPPASTGPRRG